MFIFVQKNATILEIKAPSAKYKLQFYVYMCQLYLSSVRLQNDLSPVLVVLVRSLSLQPS